ncbi:2-phospho-L-lactate guanylyltransferase [Nocardia alni]|uniref:2-phospho-L-lactate guanylyltransferase n=1 Tax=Nocardia alni TaxID=2815723 RepID=UPI001C220335|nr:2-phospho-L-lactate guanylyltransferase [Nocardia alni]
MRPDAVHAVIAVKSLERAKTRLAHELPPQARSRLVLAMLSDTVTAALAAGVGSVTVVTPDPEVSALVRVLGGAVHADPTHPDSDGFDSLDIALADGVAGVVAATDSLNLALADAAAAVRHRHGAVDLLALQADLPALRPGELRDMLTTAPASGRALVADHTGQGTAALLVRADAAPLAPLFGPDSARRHVDSGAKDLAGEWPGLRLDVDTAEDLRAAVLLGVGSATAALLGDIGWPHRVHGDLTRRCDTGHMCAR